MVNKIENWINDIDSVQDAWTAKRFYRYALEQGITDPMVIANARALVDLAEDFHKQHPEIQFDRVVEAIIAGMDPDLTLTYYSPGVIRLIRHKWRKFWRNFRKSPYATIKKVLSNR